MSIWTYWSLAVSLITDTLSLEDICQIQAESSEFSLGYTVLSYSYYLVCHTSSEPRFLNVLHTYICYH